jgi:hypothetical protein
MSVIVGLIYLFIGLFIFAPLERASRGALLFLPGIFHFLFVPLQRELDTFD